MEPKQIVYAFDVDETLELSGGPVKIDDIRALKEQGSVVGLCGNFGLVVDRLGPEIAGTLFSFLGQGQTPKDEFLRQTKKKYATAGGFVFVGNDHTKGQHASPDDARFAAAAGWEFLTEVAFAAGKRRGEVPPPFLSLCMIVRDSEKTIGALLDSVLGFDGLDELVIVDTGSIDKTVEEVLQRCEQTATLRDRAEVWRRDWADNAPVEGEGQLVARGVPMKNGTKLTLARFGWCDDFALARSYSFELAMGLWRMYLDADDVFECRHPAILAGERRADGSLKRLNLAATIRALQAQVGPELNTISIPYEYKAEDAHQDVHRIWRWGDGWCWRDAVHENVIATPTETAHTRTFAVLGDVAVVHKKPGGNDSFVRNMRILEKQLEREDLEEGARARFTYAYAMTVRGVGLGWKAVECLEETIKRCKATNFEIFAHCDLVKLWAIEMYDVGVPQALERALEAAGRFMSRFPDLLDAYEHLGWVLVLMEQYDRAHRVFAAGRTVGRRLPWSSNKEVWFTDGAAPAAEALANARLDRLEAAKSALTLVKYTQHSQCRPLFVEAQRTYARKVGLSAAMSYALYLQQAQEPEKAIEVLEEAARIGALEAEAQQLNSSARTVKKTIAHTRNFHAYKKAYAELPEHTVRETTTEQREQIMGLVRAKMLVTWADALDKEGPPIDVLFVGVQDGVYEAEVLERCPRIRATVAEVAAGASRATKALIARFGEERVRVHAMSHMVDWSEGKTFDAAVCFEVIEHLPSLADPFIALGRALKEGGRLFLSTPAPDCWVEEVNALRPFAHHVAMYGPERLHNDLSIYGFVGELCEGHDGTLCFEGVLADDGTRLLRRNGCAVGIFLPEGLKGFDARSHERGHLGGSEEAVIHLSEALARRGHSVTVYSPQPKRELGRIVAENGVLWKASREFDFGGIAHDVVFFWRCPEATRIAELGPYHKVLWLHDSYYKQPPDAYEKADNVVVLSKFHGDVLAAKDGAPRTKLTVLQNGIDAAAFPPPDESKRDPLKVLYTSSPDRGLATLLDMWPKIKAQVPGASLDIYYDWSGARWLKADFIAQLEEHIAFLASYEVQRADGEGTTTMDIRLPGGVDHGTLHNAMRTAGVWAYPCGGDGPEGENPSPETFCITAVKMAAAGCYPVVTDSGALPEVLCGGTQVDRNEGWQDVFVDTVVKALKGELVLGRKAMRDLALKRFSWDKTAEMFAKALGLEE